MKFYRFPTPIIPPFFILKDMIGDCFLIALLSYAHNFSLAEYYSRKHRYEIQSNQELLAYGFANIFSSFFQCIASGSSSSRTRIQSKFGGKTQVILKSTITN